ncbi:hypothetical protein [Tepidibacter aestuarii]|nr:hypothetical protein [Tepidibacter aestuarii]CAH2213442.1 protein of unknown function [Tepidibacter aestuarii]
MFENKSRMTYKMIYFTTSSSLELKTVNGIYCIIKIGVFIRSIKTM